MKDKFDVLSTVCFVVLIWTRLKVSRVVKGYIIKGSISLYGSIIGNSFHIVTRLFRTNPIPTKINEMKFSIRQEKKIVLYPSLPFEWTE